MSDISADNTVPVLSHDQVVLAAAVVRSQNDALREAIAAAKAQKLADDAMRNAVYEHTAVTEEQDRLMRELAAIGGTVPDLEAVAAAVLAPAPEPEPEAPTAVDPAAPTVTVEGDLTAEQLAARDQAEAATAEVAAAAAEAAAEAAAAQNPDPTSRRGR